MKKCILVIVAVVLFLSACTNAPSYQKPVAFYYCVNEMQYSINSSSIACETREGEHWGTSEETIAQYLLGPQTSTLRSPFPEDVRLLSISQEDSVVSVHLSAEFAHLSNLELTLSCSCLAMTVLEMTGAETIYISAQDAMLNGQPFMILTRDSLLLFDTTTNTK